MSWELYYEKNKGRPLRALYSRAVSSLDPAAKIAMDLGCGIGAEVIDLLSRGFEVHAVDQEVKAIEYLNSQIHENKNKLYAHVCNFESLTTWPQVDLLFAYHSLPFCQPALLDTVIEKALASVANNGIFAASFFGPEDEWVQEKKVAGISADEVKLKCTNFNILHFEEIKKRGRTALQGDKMWHFVELIAQNKGSQK